MTTITLAKIGTNQTVNYAVDELARYLKMMDASLLIDQRTYDKRDEAVANVIWVGRTELVAYDKLVDTVLIDVKDGAGVITGANERAVLIAAYRFLRELGCRWIRPGQDGEIIPEKKLDKAMLNVSVSETPARRYRAIAIEGASMHEHVYNIINWLPKVGMNAYYTQGLSPQSFYSDWYAHSGNPHREAEEMVPVTSYDAVDEEIVKRGLELLAVGHGFLQYPYGIFKKKESEITDEFLADCAIIDGKRGLFSNLPPEKLTFWRSLLYTHLCYSKRSVRDKITDWTVEYCRTHPHVSYIRFLLADGMNNHCECEECKKMRPSDWYMTILNELDEKLTAAGLDTRVSFALYVDSIWPPEKVRLNNPDRFIMNLSPSSRTYSRPLFDTKVDPDTIELPPYVRNKLTIPRDVESIIAFLNAWKRVIPCECVISDYHLMWDHYLDPGYTECAKLLHTDVTGLDKLGVTSFIMFQEQRCAFPTGLPLYAMAAGLWDKDSKFEDISHEYYEAAFGEDGPAVEAYLAKISELFDPKFMRNDHIEAHKTALERMNGIDELIDGFVASHIEQKKEVNASWKYLWYHATYAKMYAELIRRYVLEDKEGIEAQTKAFAEYYYAIEPDTHTVFDPTYFEMVYQRWIERVFANKPVEVDF